MDNIQSAELHISVISNIIFTPYFELFVNMYFGETTRIYFISHGDQIESEHQKELEESEIVVVWINLEFYLCSYDTSYVQPELDQKIIEKVVTLSKQLYTDITSYSSAQIFWLLFEDYYYNLPVVTGCSYNSNIDKINLILSDVLENVSLIDLKRLIAEVGISNAYDAKGKYRWNAPYTKVLIERVVKEFYKEYLIGRGITKKCLIIDCDNVLWGGILSEDGIEKLRLGGNGPGRMYQDFQRFILSLHYYGVIIAVCSKNDLEDVLTMFREHSEMVLKEEHVASFQVNWEDKPGNIRNIAKALNIDLNSIVFVDDSPFEIETVNVMLPEISTILFKRNMEYDQFSCFNLKTSISVTEVKKRVKTYQTNRLREELKINYRDHNDYIENLKINVDIHEALPIEYSRIAELTQRTNKCTNGRRYTVAEIKERVSSSVVKLYSVSVSDRFCDLGLVGAIEIEDDVLVLFSLSCRALGREIEKRMLGYIRERHKIYKIEYYSTGKNEAIKELLLEKFPGLISDNC